MKGSENSSLGIRSKAEIQLRERRERKVKLAVKLDAKKKADEERLESKGRGWR